MGLVVVMIRGYDMASRCAIRSLVLISISLLVAGSLVTAVHEGRDRSEECSVQGTGRTVRAPVDGGVSRSTGPRTRAIQDYMEDLNARYEWIDISNGNRLGLDDDGKQQVNMGMDFKLYDQTYTSCHICSNGMIGFVDDGNWELQDYDNKDFPRPNYRYFMAVFWDDLDPSMGGSIYYQKLENPTRFVVSWVNVPHYDMGGQNSMQAVLYSDSGIIKFNYNTLNAGASATVGLNLGDGVHYNMPYCFMNPPPRDKPADRSSIRFFLTIPPVPEEMTCRGDAPLDMVCYAQYRTYSILANLTTYEGLDDIDEFTIKLDYNTTNITLVYNGTNDIFYKENDPQGHIRLMETSEAGNDGNTKWSLKFDIMINFSFPHEDAIDCMAISEGKCGFTVNFWFSNLFRVENDLEIRGSPSFTGEFQGSLGQGDWVRGGEGITVEGLGVSYQNNPNLVPSDDFFDVRTEDSAGEKWWVNETVDGEFTLSITAKNATDEAEEFTVSLEHIPGAGECTGVVGFPLKVDADPPAPPEKLTCHAEDFDDKDTAYTGQTTTFVTWETASDAQSGLKGYYISRSDRSGTDEGNFTTDTQVKIGGLEEGTAAVYVWCVDNVGNSGEAAASGIFVDVTPPTFENFTPGENVWLKDGEIVFSVEICDRGGAGIDGETVEYTVSTKGPDSGAFEYWVPFYLQSGQEVVNVSGKFNFEEGGDNYLKWRAADMAGNGPVESPARNVKIDRTPVEFSESGDPPVEWYDSAEIVTNIRVSDIGSGVDLDSLQAAFSSGGAQGFGVWKKIDPENIKELEDGEYEISANHTYWEGRGNYVMFRGTDMVGNPLVESEKFNIKVDSAPAYFVSFSPDAETFSNEMDVECVVEVKDNGSGVDTKSVEYSYSTEGPGEKNFSQWRTAVNVAAGNPTQVLVTVEFEWGRDNYIRFRVNDKVGSGYANSQAYNIRVNSKPVAKIGEPASEMELYSDQLVRFDGLSSSDEDGDNLTYSWGSNLTVNRSLGEGPVIEAKLAPGMHTITLKVNDGHGYTVTDEIYLTVKEREKEGGGGGLISGSMPFSSRLLFIVLGLFLVIIIIIVAVVAVVIGAKKKSREKEEKEKEENKGMFPPPLAGPPEFAVREKALSGPPGPRGPPGPPARPIPPGSGTQPFRGGLPPGRTPQQQQASASQSPLAPMEELPIYLPPRGGPDRMKTDMRALPPGSLSQSEGVTEARLENEFSVLLPALGSIPPGDATGGTAMEQSAPVATGQRPSWEQMLDFENTEGTPGGDSGLFLPIPGIATPSSTPGPATSVNEEAGDATDDKAEKSEGPGDVVLTCHSCGKEYIANITELPIMVVCPLCSTEGRIDSLG